MAKSKVTLTLSTGSLQALRDFVGARSLSAAVDEAIAAHLDRLRHLAEVDEWLAELEREHGPIPTDAREWAASVVADWDSKRARRTRRVG